MERSNHGIMDCGTKAVMVSRKICETKNKAKSKMKNKSLKRRVWIFVHIKNIKCIILKY